MLPLTISAEYGLVDQEKFFNRKVASSNLDGYYLLYNGEFAYNKSYSKNYPWGTAKRLDMYDKGVLSTLYICFKPNSTINSDYLKHYFETQKWYNQISEIAVEGARNHGLLNIAVNDFFDTKHYFPILDEQKKIAIFLNLLDKRINTQKKIIREKTILKKEICNKLMSSLTNFIKLKEIAKIYQPETINTNLFCNDGEFYVYGANGIIGKYSKYNHLNSQICITCRGATCGNVHLTHEKSWITGNAMIINVDDNQKINKYFLFYFLSNFNFSSIKSGSGQPQITRKPVENILIPNISFNEQNKISVVLKTLDDDINNEKKILQLYEKQKQYLFNKLFI